MTREELDFVLKQNAYLEDGTKQACVKVKESIQNVRCTDNKIEILQSCVSIDEFMEAMRILVAFASQKKDQTVKTWYCDDDCRRISSLLCPGEGSISKDAETICPFYVDEGLI